MTDKDERIVVLADAINQLAILMEAQIIGLKPNPAYPFGPPPWEVQQKLWKIRETLVELIPE